MTEKMMVLLQAHLKKIHDTTLYDYQLEIARNIFDALIQNMQLTAGASEDDIKKLTLREIPIEISRQAGKTTAIVHIIEFILIYFTKHFERPIRIGIFAPQREQAKTDFDRLKYALAKTSILQVSYDEADKEQAKEESNAKTIVLPSGSSCYVFPVTATSKPESKTLDLIVFEESQDVDDRIMMEQIWPMGASTNAPRIYIGTAGTRICHFYRLGQDGKAIKLYFDKVAEQRRKVYEATGNGLHLIYENTVNQEMELRGKDSDEIQRPYFGKWLIGTGQFVTQEALEAIIIDRKRTFHDKHSDCYAGIDVAKNPDSTVVTVLRYNKDLKRKQLVNWLELRGENYKNQFEIIYEFLQKYNVLGVAIDSTGIGDFMPDMFELETPWRDEHTGLYRITFSAPTKSNMYKNLKVSIAELLTDLPKLDTREAERFRQQCLDLQQEWNGQHLRVHHPDDVNAHDDYPDSWALAEWAYAKYNENRVSLEVVTPLAERNVTKDESGRVTDYWPGLDD